MVARVPFVGGSYELRRKKADVQRSINLMPTLIESGSGKAAMYLKPIPGLRAFSGGGGGGGGGLGCVPTITEYGIVASDGYNENYFFGLEFLLSVDDDIWWSGNFFPGFDKPAIIDDPLVYGGYPGPSNFTTNPEALHVQSWVHLASRNEVWAARFTTDTLAKADTGTLAVTSYNVAPYQSLLKDTEDGLWVQLGAITGDTALTKINPDSPTTATGIEIDFGSVTPFEVVFTDGVVAFANNGTTNELFRRSVAGSPADYTLSGSGGVFFFAYDTDRESIWLCWPNTSYLVEFDIATGTEIRTFSIDIGVNPTLPLPFFPPPQRRFVYCPVNKMLWFTTGSGGGSYLSGISTITGQVIVNKLIDLPEFTGFSSGGSTSPTLVVSPTGRVYATCNLFLEGDEDSEVGVLGFTYVCVPE